MKEIKLSIKLITFLIITSGCDQSSTTSTVTSEEDLKTLRYLKEVEWPKAYREQDTVLLDRILGEDFQMVDQSGGWYTKSDELAWIKKHGTSYDSFYYEIKRLDVLPNGTAIIGGTGHIFNDTVKSIYQSNNVLVKRKEEWKAVLSHVSGYKKID